VENWKSGKGIAMAASHFFFIAIFYALYISMAMVDIDIYKPGTFKVSNCRLKEISFDIGNLSGTLFAQTIPFIWHY
jgi:hypothetical protein